MSIEEVQLFLERCKSDYNVAVIDMRTGTLYAWDSYQIRGRGMPSGYRVVEDISIAEWISILQNRI